jgi:hypothetical protein
MTNKYCVLQENEKIRTLLSLIKSKYKCDANDSLQEVNLEHVVKRVSDNDIRTIIKNTWHDLETFVGYEIRLLVNNSQTSLINKLFKANKDLCFILKIRHEPEIFGPIVESIKAASNIKIEVKEIKI